MQTTNKQMGGVSLGKLFSRFVMVYREYTEDRPLRKMALSDRAPKYSSISRQKPRQPTKNKTKKNSGVHTHQVSFRGRKPWDFP